MPLADLLGPATAKACAQGLGMRTVGDLVTHYPRRYARRGAWMPMGDAREGDEVTVLGEVVAVTTRPMAARRGKLTEVVITDGTEQLSLTFFNQPWRERDLKVGVRGLFAGTVGAYRGARQLAHPDYVLLVGDDATENATEVAQGYADEWIPIYSSTQKMTTWKLRTAIGMALDVLPGDESDDAGTRRHLMPWTDALRAIHHPTSDEDVARARERLAYEEAFLVQARLAQLRVSREEARAVSRTAPLGVLRDALDANLPFTLTAGQREVGEQLRADLAQNHPMHRLLQGDVGSGKTVVALRAMLDVVESGGQVAFIAPTEVLASQHAITIRSLLGNLSDIGGIFATPHAPKVQVELLTGSVRGKERAAILSAISEGSANIVIGTHALLEETVQFADLGLVVIDEQHRFGVNQRARLVERDETVRPHLLVMTATPIPRTVALTVFGDLEISTLRESPALRADVTTHVVNPRTQPQHFERVWQRMQEEVAQGHPVFVVCPRIGDAVEDSADDASDETSLASVTTVAQELSERFPNMRIATLHGRMSAEEKSAVMAGLRAEKRDVAEGNVIDIVVSTTVIEVGVDVPNATMMIILDADRFGLSQLHQLRGRIGRGSLPGLCILVSEADAGSDSRARLEALASTRDGFVLAQQDLDLRGEGDVLGSAQSGVRSSLRILKVMSDATLIEWARADVTQWVAEGMPMSERVAALMAEERDAEYLERA